MKINFSEMPRGDRSETSVPSSGDAQTNDQPSLRLHVLASGSKGNATIIEDVTSNRSLLVDCGICKRDFISRCDEVGVDPLRIEGILITHEHVDHTKGLGVVTRYLNKIGGQSRIYTGKTVHRGSEEIVAIQDSCDINHIAYDDRVSIAGMSVQVFPTSHDTPESFGFRIDSFNDSIGYMTDTGYMMDEACEALQRCRILALESNHDTQMLADGPYPYFLKQRVGSDRGHLSNDQADEVLEKLLCNELEQVVALHISENNNTYRLPWEALGATLERNTHPAHVCSAYQHRVVSI